MSDMSMENTASGDHAWVHENLAAYLAGGLSAEERTRLDAHVNACAECFDAFTEARDADRAAQRALAALLPAEDAIPFEDRIITHTRETTMSRWKHPVLRRAAYATAASIALAATGVFANIALHQQGRFNNPLSRDLVAKADEADPNYKSPMDWFTHSEQSSVRAGTAEDVRGVAQDQAVFAETGSDENKSLSKSAINAQLVAENAQVKAELTDGNSASAREIRRSKVETLVADAHKLYDATKFRESADLLRQAVIVDPQNTEAQFALRLTLDKITDREAAQIEHRNGAEVMRQNVDGDEHLIPYADLMVYPDSWPEITRKREMSFAAEDKALADARNGKPKSFDQATLGTTGVPGSIAMNDAHGEFQRGTQLGDSNGNLFTKGTTAQPGIGAGYLPFDQLATQTDAVKSYYSYGVDGTSNVNRSSSGSSGLVKTGPGTTTLTGAYLVSGPVNVSAGTTTLTGGNTYSGGVNIASGATVQTANGAINETGKFSFGAGTPANSGPSMGIDSSRFATGKVASADAPVAKTSDHYMNNQVDLKFESNDINKPSQAGGQRQGQGGQQQQTSMDLPELGKTAVVGNMPDPQVKWRDDGKLNQASDWAGGTAAATQPHGASFDVDQATSNEKKYTGLEFVAAGEKNIDPNSALAAAAPQPSQPTATRPAGAQSVPQPVQQPVQAIAQLKIIRNGTIEFEVRSFDDTYLTVARIVADDGGFVSSTSSEKLANGHVRGQIIVRVPPERLERFLLELRSLGDLKAQQIAANDVTKQYTDTESELRGLRTMETRLIDLIKNGKGEVKDLVEAEKQLGEYRVRIEKLEGELSYYNNLVSLATISITAYEKDIAKPTAASEQEIVNLSVETEEVEAQYQAARKTLDDAKARVVESQLRNTDAEHVAAHIVADVPQDKADFVAGQLKTLGKVASFNRDRKQTTTGGTGVPSVAVEQKDTRITIDLFNLANLAPRETTVIRVAVPNVETTYTEILGKVRTAAPDGADDKAPKSSGRVLSSNLTGQLPEQMAADIRAEVRTENAADVLAAIKKSGEVLTSSLATNSDNATSTAAKRGIQLTLINIASVPPKQYHTLNIAVRDVDKAYNDLLTEIRKDVSKDDAAGTVNPLLPPTVGRILTSGVNGQQPEQKTADVQADIRSDKMSEVLTLIQNAAGNEVMNNSTAESQEQINITRTKERLQVRFINVAAIAPRETRSQRLVAINVPDSYKKIQDAFTALAAKGDVRVMTSQLNQSDPRNVTANLAFEARRDALPAVDEALAAAGISFLSGNTDRSPDTAGTLDSKIRFNIESIIAADSLEPRRTITLALEVDNVDQSLDTLRDSIKKLLPPGEGLGGTDVREIDFNVARDKNGNAVAGLALDVPRNDSPRLAQAISSMHGTEKNNQVAKNSTVPDKEFARERYLLTIMSRPTIIPSGDKSVGNSFRAALSNASGALIYSLYLVVTGLLFLLPFALIAWPIWAILKRKKPATT